MSKRTALLLAVGGLEAAALFYLLVAAPRRGDAARALPAPTATPPAAAPPATAGEPAGVGAAVAPNPTATTQAAAREAAPAPATAPAAEPPLVDSVTVFGTVTTEHGTTPERLAVVLTGPAGARLYTQSTPYAIGGVTPGRWTLRCQLRGFKPHEATIDVDGRRALLRHDITLRTAITIRVRFLTPEGDSLAAKLAGPLVEAGQFMFAHGPLIAVATAEPPVGDLPPTASRSQSGFGTGSWTGSLDARALGGAAVPEGWDGFLELRAPPPVFVSAVLRHVVLATQRVEAGTEEVTLQIPVERVLAAFGTVRVRLTDAASGEPITEAEVTLNDQQSSGTGVPIDEEGRIEWRLQPPGLLRLRVWSNEHEMVQHYVRVRPGATTDLGTLALERAVAITGSVRDEAGNPVGCAVSVHRLDRLPFRQELDTGLFIGMAEPGQLEVGWVGRGPTLLRFEAEGLAAHALLVDTSGGAVEGVAVTLRAGVEVTLRSGVPPTEPVLWWLLNAEGLPVWTRWVAGAWPQKLRLAPGKYRLVVHDAEGVERATHPITVEAAPVSVDVPR